MAPRSSAARTWKVRVRNERGVRRCVTGVIRRCHGFRSIFGQSSESALEVRLHLGPLVVDDGVVGGVPQLAAAYDHVLAEDPLEAGRERLERRARALVARFRLELDPQAAELLEGVAEEEILGLHVDAGSPDPARVPGVADLEAAVLGAKRQGARAPHRLGSLR